MYGPWKRIRGNAVSMCVLMSSLRFSPKPLKIKSRIFFFPFKVAKPENSMNYRKFQNNLSTILFPFHLHHLIIYFENIPMNEKANGY